MRRKLLPVAIFLFWLSSMSWLVYRDVLPALMSQEVPALKASDWLETEELASQSGVFDKTGRIGTIFTNYRVDEETTQREDLVVIERFPLPIAPLFLNADSTFTADGLLDEVTLEVLSQGSQITLHGERFHADFSFELEAGSTKRNFKIPLAEAGLVSGAFKPFANLAELETGQTWRMQVFNPIAAITGVGSRFIPMLVKVTGKETIQTPQGPTDCFVVEADKAKAWVDSQGKVVRQEMTLPVGGTITIIPEAHDEEAFDESSAEYRLARRGS